MFYANPSAKKAFVGLRGAWAALGVEYNFPSGHSWVTVSPVDSAIRQNPDGSATVVISRSIASRECNGVSIRRCGQASTFWNRR